jgi:hypothetical protein
MSSGIAFDGRVKQPMRKHPMSHILGLPLLITGSTIPALCWRPGGDETVASTEDEAEAIMALPIPKHPITLIARKDYKVMPLRVLSLCVVQAYSRKEVRLYKWRRNSEHEPWKVALANFAVHDINLEEVSQDATSLAHEHGVHLEWGGRGPELPVFGDEVSVFDDVEDETQVEPDNESRPSCPNCGTSECTVPIVYGFVEFKTEVESADYELGGWSYSVESPLWHCRTCGAQWGRVTWSESLPPRRIVHERGARP